MQNQEKSNQLLVNRLSDLSSRAINGYYVTQTEFLDMYQLSVALNYLNSNYIPYIKYGGYDVSERALIMLLPYPDYKLIDEAKDFAVKVLYISHTDSHKSRILSHRDYLGALMNLGIERKVIGDIIVQEGGATVFCLNTIDTYISNHLLCIGKTKVSITLVEYATGQIDIKQCFITIKGTVASLRLDNILKMGTKLSRTISLQYIKSNKIYVNGREILQASYTIKEKDIISIRGIGKIRLNAIGKLSKKGRIYVEIDQYN